MKSSRQTPSSPAPVRGHRLGKPRLTPAGWLLILLWLGVPAMLLGAVLDFGLQWLSGECVGLWCLLR
jgi:hypothetical protein